MENTKIRITDAAQAKMKQLKTDGEEFKILMVNNC